MTILSFFYFVLPKLLVVKDIRLGILNRLLQLAVIIYTIYNLFYYEIYYKSETPNGYLTSFWAETGDLYEYQRNYSSYLNNSLTNTLSNNYSNTNQEDDEFYYCNNPDVNYIYALPYWDYSNASCINLPYSEMYAKGENQIFYMTMFTENDIKLYNCKNDSYINSYLARMNQTMKCQISDKLDGNCLCQNYKNYFTIGAEKMKFVFDYKYSTTFEKGGNYEDESSISVESHIYNSDGELYKIIGKNQNIKFTLDELLKIANIDLNTPNTAVDRSLLSNYVTGPIHPLKRITGIDIIMNIDCYNYKLFTEEDYGTTICKIKPSLNEGWSSKGSHINYLLYPDVSDENSYSIYYDRYKYGVKIKFMFSGQIGQFNIYNLINALISSIVLTGTVTTIIIIIITNFLCNYTNKLNVESSSDAKTIHFENFNRLCSYLGIIKNSKTEQIDDDMSNISISSNIDDIVIKNNSSNNNNESDIDIENNLSGCTGTELDLISNKDKIKFEFKKDKENGDENNMYNIYITKI